MKILAILTIFFGISYADIVQNQLVKTSINILNEFVITADENQTKHFNDAKAVAIVPNVSKTGLVLTASKATGIFMAKNDENEWSSPFFINYIGGSIGIQGGVSSADLIIVFNTSRSYANLFNGKDTISLNANIAIFNDGMNAGINTDVPEISAYMLTRGKSRGVFVGASLDLARISINNQETNDYYDRIYTLEDIYDGSTKQSKYTTKLREILHRYFN
ncbi:lipid-binding SYLF domain-containing protein [Campylobacter majalis]|uniref:lipid-binding SYLF domain-containing protein n=1 Tax=Campylobacter majalis TaxID=2790656 RepID=UPI003D689E3B